MATRQTTGTSPLLDIIKEVYDTKLRMKQVLNTESDDFEEYATIVYNLFVDEYNKGYKDGYLDGFHSVIPSYIVDPAQYEAGYKEHEEYTPSIPTYTTDTDLENLIVIMQDNLRCRMLLKAALDTESDEFVTYPDLYLQSIETQYDDGYDTGYTNGYNTATYISGVTCDIVCTQNIVTITTNLTNPIEYKIDDGDWQEYDEPFEIFDTCYVTAKILIEEPLYYVSDPVYCIYDSAYDYSTHYFTIKARSNTPVYMGKSGHTIYLQASTDNGSTWTTQMCQPEYYVLLAELEAGEKLLLRGTNYSYGGEDWNFHFFIPYGDYDFEGNISSLIAGQPSGGSVTTPYKFKGLFENSAHYGNYGPANCSKLVIPFNSISAHCFENMFNGCSNLQTPPKILPATTLAERCYFGMFAGCWSLTSAPKLPATTLADSCYWGMFDNCDSLTTAPELPATTLAERCYYNMFSGCNSLTTPPALPATTLAEHCYRQMFQYCTSLTTPPALPATTLAEHCYVSMFYECTSLTTAPSLPATTLAYGCYSGMFQSCTSLTTAPILPATTLSGYCYSGMFRGCTLLNYIECLATNISASYCTTDWVYGVAATGTFVKARGVSWRTGDSGIPSGWTVQDAA